MAAYKLTWFSFFNQPLISVPSTCTSSTKRKTSYWATTPVSYPGPNKRNTCKGTWEGSTFVALSMVPCAPRFQALKSFGLGAKQLPAISSLLLSAIMIPVWSLDRVPFLCVTRSQWAPGVTERKVKAPGLGFKRVLIFDFLSLNRGRAGAVRV